MEIEIYGRIDDARLAAHGIPGCRAIYPQKRAAAGRAETRIRSFHVCASVRSLAGCTCAWSDACASHRAGYRARMTLSLRDYVRIRHGSRVRVASRARRWRVRGVWRRRMENCFVETYNSTRFPVPRSPPRRAVRSFVHSFVRSLARSRSFPPGYRLERFALDDVAAARYQIFAERNRKRERTRVGNTPRRFVHSVNKTPEEDGTQSSPFRARILANRILSIYPSVSHSARARGARANTDQSRVAPGMHPAGNVIISPRPRERSSLERSLPALSAPLPLPYPSPPRAWNNDFRKCH